MHEIQFSPLSVCGDYIDDESDPDIEHPFRFEARSWNRTQMNLTKTNYRDTQIHLLKGKLGKRIMTRAFRKLCSMESLVICDDLCRLGAAEIYHEIDVLPK